MNANMSSMNVTCTNIFGHKFEDVKITDRTEFKRVDCQRKNCNYSMDAVAFKRTIDRLPPNLKSYMAKKGPRIISD